MKFIESIARRMGFVPEKTAVRAYAGAQMNRFTEDWKTFQTSIDKDIYQALAVLRARSRDLSQNNDYAKRFVNLCKSNIVGSNGFSLQVKAFDRVKNNDGEWQLKYDELANTIIEDCFSDWARRENCTVTGTMSFIDVQNLAIMHAARDGEYLIRKIYSPQYKYGFMLQVLQPDILDERLNKELPNGGYIRMGIEFDVWRKPVAYWLKQISPSTEFWAGYHGGTAYIRVDAKNIYHGFDTEHSSQSRGVPWMTASMFRLRMLSGFEEASIINARAGAGKMGFFKSANGEQMLTGDTDASGNMLSASEPGTFETLPPGIDFVPYEPKFPSDQHTPFMKTSLRGIASGMGVGYNTFANDLEGVNYSSIRAGVIDEREMWKTKQTWIKQSLLEPLFADWLAAAMLSGVVKLPMVKFDKFNAPKWIGRRWAWVDPMKDIEAHLLARQCGFETSSQIVGEQGGDLEEKYSEIQRENELALKHNLTLKVEQVKIDAMSAPYSPAVVPEQQAQTE